MRGAPPKFFRPKIFSGVQPTLIFQSPKCKSKIFVGEPHLQSLDLRKKFRCGPQNPIVAHFSILLFLLILTTYSFSLLHRYYFGRCSNGPHTSIFPTFVASHPTRGVNSLHSFCVQVPQSRTVSRSYGFFVHAANQWNSLPANCFPDRYKVLV